MPIEGVFFRDYRRGLNRCNVGYADIDSIPDENKGEEDISRELIRVLRREIGRFIKTARGGRC